MSLSDLACDDCLRAALKLLLGHCRCARALGRPPGDFPVPAADVCRAGGTEAAVAELIACGVLVSVPAATPPASAGGLALTPGGAVWARRVTAPPGGAAPKLRVRPDWDPVRRELHVGGEVVLRLRRRAPNQGLVLLEFQECGWHQRIDDPLPPPEAGSRAERLRQTVRSLNRGQQPARLRFRVEAGGRGVRWAPAG
jgi:hypothetical protein